jgi:NAD(P)-dependent dehydrogenase (short-subunit alcohol dehydrogenase family)
MKPAPSARSERFTESGPAIPHPPSSLRPKIRRFRGIMRRNRLAARVCAVPYGKISGIRGRSTSMQREEKVALVTGAGSGIGRGCALALLAAGWRVVLTGRRSDALEGTRAASGVAGDRATSIICDVSREEAVAALYDQIRDRFGRLDLLFNNAGVSARAALPDELSNTEWRRTVDVNLNGAFFCLAGAFKLMRDQTPRGGRIINNGSISAHVPRSRSIAYTATKHAITGLTRAAALDGRAFDIAVGQIDIGNVVSDLTADMVGGVPQADGTLRTEPRMEMSAVAQTFMAMVNLPLSANVLFMTVMATQMPFVGRG